MKRVVHIVNQYFAGIGAEEKADVAVGILDKLSGPSAALQRTIGDIAEVSPTIYFGDNYFHENQKEATSNLMQEITKLKPSVVVLGPAFNSGRYGVACVEIGRTIATELGIPALTAMYEENPGVETYRALQELNLLLVPTSETVSGMSSALKILGKMINKIINQEELGSPIEEGYIPRGIRYRKRISQTGAARAVTMLRKKLANEPYNSEIPMQIWDKVIPTKPVKNIAKANLAVVTTSGVVPWGNPDGFKTFRNTFWRRYPIGELATMEPGVWEAVHGGYNVNNMNANPLYGVPLDALRKLQAEGEFGTLYPAYFVIPGNQGSPAEMKRVGQEIAAELKSNSVDAVLLVST